MSWEFDIPGPPVPKDRARRDPKTGRWYTPQRTVEYEKEVFYLAKQSGLKLSKDRWYSIEVTAYVYSFSRIADRDNIIKAIMDGVGHFAGFNDKQFNSLRYQERGVDVPELQRTRVLIEDNGPRRLTEEVPEQGTLGV